MTSWERVETHAFMLRLDPASRTWVRRVPDGLLRVIRSTEHEPDGPRLHLSISHAGDADHERRYPTWDEQKDAVHRFGLGRAYESIILPPNDPSWVNVHPTTFHWWEHRP